MSDFKLMSNNLLTIYLWIEVHIFCIDWEIKWHGSRVNFVKREALLTNLHVNSCHFISQSIQKMCTSIHIFMLKRRITPKKSKKSRLIFRHVTRVIHWKIFATVFLCFIAGECHESVNICRWSRSLIFH